jgi:carbonic anhydrase
MAEKREKPEEIVMKLRQVEVLQGQGMSVAEALRQIGMTQQRYYRWHRQSAGERSGANYGFVDAVAATQVKLTIDLIRHRSQVIRDLEANGTIRIVGAMYDIDNGQVTLLS